ncbi:MAG: gamma-glutamyltransferase family protein, partial [Dehalococcoidia bacterium]
PGLPDCWAAIHERHGAMPLTRLFARAIDLAANGFPLSRDIAAALECNRERLAQFEESARIFLPSGAPPRPGDLLVQKDLARTLQTVAEGGRAAFYEGPVAEALTAAFKKDADGLISGDDLQRHGAEVGEPLRARYRRYTITEQPPISQGHILLQELLMLDQVDLPAMDHLGVDSIHTMIEVKKLAFADRTAAAGDPRFVAVDWDRLLSPDRARARVEEVDPLRAHVVSAGDSKPTDTTQFVVGDADGRAVTFIQSVYHPFGSAAVAAGTGMLLNNRMLGFGTDPALPNVMAPGKRTVHTLNTYTVFRDGEFMLAGGTPGADFQVQTNMQILTAILDYGLDIQAAVDAPRWGHRQGRTVFVESRLPAATRRQLRRRGHIVQIGPAWTGELGRAMLLARGRHGWEAVADQRRESAAAGY